MASNVIHATAGATLADHVHDGVAIYEPSGQLLYWNAAAAMITGWSKSSADAASLRGMPAGLAEIRPGKWIEQRHVSLVWEGSPAEAVIFNDVSAERRLSETQQQLRDIGLIDPLTGLIGERLLKDHSRRAISLAQRDGRSAGLIWLQLDRYLGATGASTAVADEVMRQCARKVERAIRGSDVAARPEPEALAVMLTAVGSSADLRIVGVRLLLLLSAPCLVEGRERSVRAAIGGALSPIHGLEPDALLDAARAAARQGSGTGDQVVLAGARP